MKHFFSDVWHGIVMLFVFVFFVAVLQYFFKFLVISAAIIGALGAIIVLFIASMLFGIPKWVKLAGIIISAVTILALEGPQNFLVILLAIFILDRIFHR